MSNIDSIILNGTEYTLSGSGGSGVTDAIKIALLQIAQKSVYVDDGGQDYYNDLYDAFYPAIGLVSIDAVYTQVGTVYDTDSLETLRNNLIVTAHFEDSSTQVVSTYTLSGTLEEGTSTITVSYGGKTDTFNVTVVHAPFWRAVNIPNEFKEGTSVNNSYNSNYNGYYLANNGRSAWCEFEILLEVGYVYTFSFNTVASGTKYGIATYKATCLDAFENHQSIQPYFNVDSGWQSGQYVFTPSENMVFQVQTNVTKASLAQSGITDLWINREVASA